jgi:hypothetical protein
MRGMRWLVVEVEEVEEAEGEGEVEVERGLRCAHASRELEESRAEAGMRVGILLTGFWL